MTDLSSQSKDVKGIQNSLIIVFKTASVPMKLPMKRKSGSSLDKSSILPGKRHDCVWSSSSRREDVEKIKMNYGFSVKKDRSG